LKPHIKKFLDDSGCTLDEANEFLRLELKRRGLDKRPDDEFLNKMAVKAKEWKEQMIKDLPSDELYAECKRRNII